MTQQSAIQKSAAQSIEDMLYAAQEEIGAVLPREIGVARMLTVALELIRGDSNLQKCISSEAGRVSIVQGVIEAAQLGLLLTKHLGHGYLVPFRSSALSEKFKQDIHLANFMLGYRGITHLARRSDPNIAHIHSRIVFDEQDHEIIQERPFGVTPAEAQGKQVQISKDGTLSGFLGAYSIVLYKEGTGIPTRFHFMAISDIQKRRNASKTKQLDTPWYVWTNDMVLKCPTRALVKVLDIASAVTEAMVRDEYRELVEEEKPKLPMPRRLSAIQAEVVQDKPSLSERIDTMFNAYAEIGISREAVLDLVKVQSIEEIKGEDVDRLAKEFNRLKTSKTEVVEEPAKSSPPKTAEKKPSEQAKPNTEKPKQTEKEIIAEMIRTAKTNKDLIEISNRISDSYASEFLTQAEAKQLSESLGEHSPQ